MELTILINAPFGYRVIKYHRCYILELLGEIVDFSFDLDEILLKKTALINRENNTIFNQEVI